MSPSTKTTKPCVVPAKVAKLEELILFNSKLRFCPEQLQNLNYLFNKTLERNLEPSGNGLCSKCVLCKNKNGFVLLQ